MMLVSAIKFVILMSFVTYQNILLKIIEGQRKNETCLQIPPSISHNKLLLILHVINAYANYGEHLSISSHDTEQKQNFDIN